MSQSVCAYCLCVYACVYACVYTPVCLRLCVCVRLSEQFELVYFDNIWLARVQQYRW